MTPYIKFNSNGIISLDLAVDLNSGASRLAVGFLLFTVNYLTFPHPHLRY